MSYFLQISSFPIRAQCKEYGAKKSIGQNIQDKAERLNGREKNAWKKERWVTGFFVFKLLILLRSKKIFVFAWLSLLISFKKKYKNKKKKQHA